MAKTFDSSLIETKHKPQPVAEEVVRAEREQVQEGASLNFKVSPEFRRRFREFAGKHDFKLNELLVQSFEVFVREHHGR
jgi:hypothetical protein